MIISTKRIFEALSFYLDKGYKLAEVPLIVREEISNVTKPEGRENFYHAGDNVYVASAEQSFIQMIEDGVISTGKWIAITPCVRDEEVYDDTHFKTFLKVEICVVGEECVNKVLLEAEEFFSSQGATCGVTKENEVYDLNIGSIEVGSYGCRKTPSGTTYTFGTAVAEPRLTYALMKIKGE